MGNLKGWKVIKSTDGWFDLVSPNGLPHSERKYTRKEIKEIIRIENNICNKK